MVKKKSKFYAVRNTNQIFENWLDCERVVKGTKGVEFKSFPTKEQAEAYLRGEEPVLSTKKTSEIVPYVSESGIKGTIRMAEDSDPLLWGIEGFYISSLI
jgi:caulimovirus viroplasmin